MVVDHSTIALPTITVGSSEVSFELDYRSRGVSSEASSVSTAFGRSLCIGKRAREEALRRVESMINGQRGLKESAVSCGNEYV